MKIFTPQTGKNWPWKVVFSHPPSWIYVPMSLRYRTAATRYWPIVFLSWRHFLNSYWSFIMYRSKLAVALLLPKQKNVSFTFTFVFKRKLLQLQRRKWTRQLFWKAVAGNRQILWHCGASSDPRRSCRRCWAACLWRGGRANFTKLFFFPAGRHQRLVCFPCYEIQSFHNKRIKGMNECVYWVSTALLQNKLLRISA